MLWLWSARAGDCLGKDACSRVDSLHNLLTRKLELFGSLSRDDKALLDETIARTRVVARGENIIHEGDAPEDVHLVLSGFACRYKILKNGKRQIFAYLLPGDFCDLHVFILKAMDHSIGALTRSTIVDIPRTRVLELAARPAIARALWWVTLVDEGTLREWVVNVGSRDAETRLSHLFCELHARLESVGLTEDGRYSLPLTQTELGDTVGLSSVHVNRTLQELRARELIRFKGNILEILDVKSLQKFCSFTSNYLHLEVGKSDKRKWAGVL